MSILASFLSFCSIFFSFFLLFFSSCPFYLFIVLSPPSSTIDTRRHPSIPSPFQHNPTTIIDKEQRQVTTTYRIYSHHPNSNQ
ncbi:hypothetical protein K457DRAFT_809653 [Linnemannia elongata AG-77]|uniref:Uncharacterized protein n=1 Tax=Linnemannia elongata AG-77 TaxID=1314771 RepID=A0A197JK19_9FUNG|nr:hypothetical protein K457DRAFT_809653 [Linnemannia elongata AG-77]